MRTPFLAFLFLATVASVLPAQSTNGSFNGRVSDPSKARVVDATVAAISVDTNLRYKTATNANGEYTLTSLPPGAYRIEIEKPGFKKLIKPDVTLHVQDALELDFEMTIGSTSESITVEGGAPFLDTESATVSTLVDHQFVEGLPLNGRSFQTLIMLTPGVVVTPTSFDDQGQFSVNGQRADANYFTVDGVSANFGVTAYFPMVQSAGGALPALSVSGGTNSIVSVDAMQEFRVQTSSFAPEFGRTPGGQVSIATRSGTNDFHGALFEYFRNDVLDANNWFNGHTNNPPLPKAKERQNDFGGVFGGPLIKDRTFLFFSYEGLRLRQPVTEETVVPDDASRRQAPATMQPYLNAYPVANGAELGGGVAQFSSSYSNPTSLNAYSIRVDHAVNATFHLFGRYNYSPSSLDQRGGVFSLQDLSTVESLDSVVHTFTVGLTALIKPSIVNEVRANYSNNRLKTKFTLDRFGGASPLSDSLLFPSGFSSSNSAFLFYLAGGGEYAQGKDAIDEQRQFNVIDNLTRTSGGHELKFGVDYRRLAPFSDPFAYRDFAEFLGVGCPASGSCQGYALSGTVPGASTTVYYAQPAAFQSDALLSQNLSLYGQDTVRVTHRLTLTYGLRWELNPPLKGKNLANQPFTVSRLNNPSMIALAPRGTPLYDTSYGNFAPRVGIALQVGGTPNWETVVRGGFGIFYDLGPGALGGATSYFPFEATKTLIDAVFPLSQHDAAAPAFSTTPPVPAILVADPNLKLPRTYEWNVALEQSLRSKQSLSLSYIGAAGRELLRNTSLISPNANFAYLGVTTNSATSDYHALQIKFERRFSQGLQALASYTWSHSIDIASTDAFANYLNTPTAVANPNIDRGNSDFDVRHAFTTGVTYDLPSPGWNSAAHTALGGWSVDGFIFVRSAPPVDVISGLVYQDGIALYPRPNLVPGVSTVLHGPQYPGGKILNSAAFAAPSTGQQGDFGRNVLRAFGASQADIACQREFHFTERMQLRFRAEFFNIFNQPNFGTPMNNLTSPLFGYSTQILANSLGSGGANGGLNPLYQIGGPRSIQLALKLQF